MTANSIFPKGRRLCSALLVGTVLGGLAAPALAQGGQPPAAPPPVVQMPTSPTPVVTAPQRTILSVTVTGNQRLEPETVLSYTALRPGEAYDNERLDTALRDLLATELFADVQIAGADTGNLVIQVRENPVINRIVLEGNRRIKRRQDQPRDPARAAPDLHPLARPRRRRPDHRAVPPPGPLRRHGRAADRPARPESRRRGVRDQRGPAVARSAGSTSSATRSSATAA